MTELGRLVEDAKDPKGALSALPDDWRDRVAQVVAHTRFSAVGKLGRPGWLRAPDLMKHNDNHAFGHVFGRNDVELSKDKVDGQADRAGGKQKKARPGSHEEREHLELERMEAWENALANTPLVRWEDLERALTAVDQAAETGDGAQRG
jgi:hypothetical protein